MKQHPLSYLIVAFVLTATSTKAEVSNYFAEVSCEQQAKDVEFFASQRNDRIPIESAKNYAELNLSARYINDYKQVIEWVYAAPSSTPSQLHETAIHDCTNRGGDPDRPAMTRFGKGNKGSLSEESFERCVALGEQLVNERQNITDVEKKLAKMNAEVDSTYKRLSSDPSARNVDIDRYNALALNFQNKLRAYEELGQRYNKKSESYNSVCADRHLAR